MVSGQDDGDAAPGVARSQLDERARGAQRFVDKVAVVAGGGQGIGSATARRLAAEGATVLVADLVAASCDRVVAELTAAGAQASSFVGDLTSLSACQQLVDEATRRYGRLDVLVNVVGGTIWNQPFHDYVPDQIEAEVAKSLWPAMWLCWAATPVMIAQHSGAIVNLGTHAMMSVDRVPYAAAKGGVIALTRSLSRELAQFGVRVNCVAPHSTEASDRVTPRNPAQRQLTAEEQLARTERLNARRRAEIPMGRRGTAEEQAAAIAFAASDDASFMTGQVIPVGGGALFV
jgi:NAD(P)-dependent dehydrogenase (short-subunit alcohol dehydrogenase family)